MADIKPSSKRDTIRTLAVYTALATTAATLFAACATSSGVVPDGQGVYMVARTQKGTRGSATPVKMAALAEANKYCEAHGKVIKVIKTVQKDMKPFQSDASAEVYFKCLSPDDPELKQPVVIEEIRE